MEAYKRHTIRAEVCQSVDQTLCAHCEQHELARENSWPTFSIKKIYKAYLRRWVIPQWGGTELSAVKPIHVESWLRRLSLAKSSCTKIRNLMSVLFNRRRTGPESHSLGASERKASHAAHRAHRRGNQEAAGSPRYQERTLVLLAGCTGLRHSKLFGLKWSDIDFVGGTMNVTRSVVYGVAGPCKTESSQKPVPLRPLLADALQDWRTLAAYKEPSDWVFASKRHRGRAPLWGQAILRRYVRPCRTSWHSETLRLAHLSTHLLNASTERRDRSSR